MIVLESALRASYALYILADVTFSYFTAFLLLNTSTRNLVPDPSWIQGRDCLSLACYCFSTIQHLVTVVLLFK